MVRKLVYIYIVNIFKPPAVQWPEILKSNTFYFRIWFSQWNNDGHTTVFHHFFSRVRFLQCIILFTRIVRLKWFSASSHKWEIFLDIDLDFVYIYMFLEGSMLSQWNWSGTIDSLIHHFNDYLLMCQLFDWFKAVFYDSFFDYFTIHRFIVVTVFIFAV